MEKRHNTLKGNLGQAPQKQVSQDQCAAARASSMFSFDACIRCYIVFGHDGEMLEVRSKEGATLEPDQDTSLALELASTLLSRTRRPGRYHGKVSSLAVACELLTVLAYPVSDKLVMVTADPSFPLERTGELGRFLPRLFYWVGDVLPVSEIVLSSKNPR